MALNQKDLDQIEEIMDEKFNEAFKNLPTKDEFFSKMDEVMGELKDKREEETILSNQVSDHENRIQNLENSLP